MKTNQKLPKYLTMKDFRQHVINWSDDTIRRRIENEGMPAKQEPNGRWVFPTEQLLDWFKRRYGMAG